jgi:hypothetical protein
VTFDPAAISSAEIPLRLTGDLFYRSITREQIRAVVNAPERLSMRPDGLWVAQAKTRRPDKPDAWWPYLLRVVLDVRRKPPMVVTAYWTSRLKKFGSADR